MRRIALVIVAASAVWLTGCGGSRHAPMVENPYAESAHSFAAVGVSAMGRERWDAAERSFERELVAAQMADDTAAIVLAHYNLGTVWLAAGAHARGREQLQQTLDLANRYGLPVMTARASLALALDQARAGTVPDTPVLTDIRASWPADIQLSAGRLALYRHDPAGARRAYERVLRRAGTDRAGLILQAEAHLGLAMVARAERDDSTFTSELQRTLTLCRKAGAPRVAADALLMLGVGKGAAADRQDALERALAIYRGLQDEAGQRRALVALVALSAGDTRVRWQQRLHALDTGGAAPAEESH